MLKNVDILSTLEKVMEHNTRFYISDFQKYQYSESCSPAGAVFRSSLHKDGELW